MKAWLLAVIVSSWACGGAERPPEEPSGERKATLPDSLVATAPGGVEVWFTLARPGKSVDGTPCVDRALEIRKGDSRIPVPLLYTAAPPDVVNDTTLRARLSDHCRPGDTYLVDLRTGRPVRER